MPDAARARRRVASHSHGAGGDARSTFLRVKKTSHLDPALRHAGRGPAPRRWRDVRCDYKQAWYTHTDAGWQTNGSNYILIMLHFGCDTIGRDYYFAERHSPTVARSQTLHTISQTTTMQVQPN